MASNPFNKWCTREIINGNIAIFVCFSVTFAIMAVVLRKGHSLKGRSLADLARRIRGPAPPVAFG